MTKLNLKKGSNIDDKCEILFPITNNYFTQSYRAKKNISGENIIIDLINLGSLPSTFFSDNGELIQTIILKKLNHPNIEKLLEYGETIIDKQKYAYLIFKFFSGESLCEKLKREGIFSPYESILIIIELFEALRYLHNLKETIIHNNINLDTIKLAYSSNNNATTILTGFEQARGIIQNGKNLLIKELSLFHTAPELFNGVFTPQSDLYSAGTVLYHLIFGIPPYYNEGIVDSPLNKQKSLLENERNKPLNFTLLNDDIIDDHLKNTIVKALSINPEDRFQSAEEFSKALKREVILERTDVPGSLLKQTRKKEKIAGTGFDEIAGMNELKQILFNEVIRVFNEKERFEIYGILPPNGILLYGPPGCGKTFIAEKLCEEVGFNFLSIKGSDLASPYVHGTQGKIGELFKNAEKDTPAIIYIDEINTVIPNSEGDVGHHYEMEINEFLSQLNNCAERGILVIGSTNFPNKIDARALRSGRLEKHFYVAPPDFIARKELFKLYLKNRPLELGIDYDDLAKITEYYVSSDIRYLVIEAARKAELSDSRITMNILHKVIEDNKPSVPIFELEKYEKLNQIWNKERQNLIEKSQLGFQIPKNKNNDT